MTRPDLVLSLLVCAFDPATRTIDATSCVHVCEVVASVPDCAQRLIEIKRVMPANLTLGSFPECFRPSKGCRS